MDSGPAISVILPAFNRAGIIRRAVDSVLNQDFADFELIVVDDGSSDQTLSVLEAIEDPRLRIVRHQRNRGSNAARNSGIHAAAAPLLCFLDSDDAFLPHKLGAVQRFFADRPDVDLLLDSYVKYFPEGAGRERTRRRNPVIDDSKAFQAALFSRRLWKATSAISVRRRVALQAGLFDETVKRRQDFDFLVRVARIAGCASTDALAWVKHVTPGGISEDPQGFAEATLEITRRYPEYRADPAFRPGLARDVARHFTLLLWRRRWDAAKRDTALLEQEFGGREFRRLLREGASELVVRHLRRWISLRR